MRQLAIFLMVSLCCSLSASAAAPGPDTLAELKQFGDFPHIDIKRLLDGEILSQRGPLMKFPNGISSQLCFAVPSPPAETIKRLQAWDTKRCPSLKVYTSGELSNPCDLKDFNTLQLHLDPNIRPVKRLFDETLATSASSSVLNLTQIEAAGLARCVGKDPSPKNVSSCWTNVLFPRATDFQHNGFANTLPYEFDVEHITPASHLHSMLQEQVQISHEFAPLLEGAGLVKGGAGITSIKPAYYWRLFQADHHATLSLGATYDLAVGDRFQRLEVEYYVSGTYYMSATLYEVWPIRDGGRTGSLVWCDVLCSAPRLRFASGIERLAAGVILVLEFKNMIRCFQDSFKTT